MAEPVQQVSGSKEGPPQDTRLGFDVAFAASDLGTGCIRTKGRQALPE